MYASRSRAYSLATAGSDWNEIKVRNVASATDLSDHLKWVKFSGISWTKDSKGFFYSRFPEPAAGQQLKARLEHHTVYYHRIGTPQSADELVFRDEKNPQRFHTLATTEDERFAILSVSDRGTGKNGNSIHVRDLSKGETTFKPVFGTIGDAVYSVLDSVGDHLLVETNHKAPNGRVASSTLARFRLASRSSMQTQTTSALSARAAICSPVSSSQPSSMPSSSSFSPSPTRSPSARRSSG